MVAWKTPGEHIPRTCRSEDGMACGYIASWIPWSEQDTMERWWRRSGDCPDDCAEHGRMSEAGKWRDNNEDE